MRARTVARTGVLRVRTRGAGRARLRAREVEKASEAQVLLPLSRTGGGVKGEDGRGKEAFRDSRTGFQSQTTRATLKTALKTAKNPNKNRPNGIF